MEFPSDEMRRAALGEMPCDLLIKDGVLVLPNTHEVVEGDIAIHGGHIVGLFEEYEAKKTLDADGMYICPGLIDGHIHVESTMLTLTRFSTLALSHGVTTIVCDPHEIANVCGISGVAALIKESYNMPMSVLFTASSCVPASPLEMGGAVLDSRDVMQLLSSDKVVALGEMMNFPGLLQGEAIPVSKVRVAKEMGMRVDGHSPLLSGKELDAYILMGAQSDHECSLGEEALEKLRKGMWVMIREGTSAHNLDLLAYLLHKGVNLRRCMLVTDDR
ncbi:MAG: amidohydrolase family protein, partial [Methermicoccaceae archaeon]